eukprot:1140989-Pelagomonas_calceolata.AAC.1
MMSLGGAYEPRKGWTQGMQLNKKKGNSWTKKGGMQMNKKRRMNPKGDGLKGTAEQRKGKQMNK